MVKLISIKHMKCSKNVSKIFNPYNIFPNVTPGKIERALKKHVHMYKSAPELCGKCSLTLLTSAPVGFREG